MFADFHNTLADDRNSLTAGVMKSILSKMSGYALRIALVLHITEIAGKSTDDNFPDCIPSITAETMRNAITLVEWYRRETGRILHKIKPGSGIAVDREVTAIVKHIQNRGGQTTARLVSQYVSAFSGVGGAGRAMEKLESMTRNGQLLVSEQKAVNRRMVRVYTLPDSTYALPDGGLSDDGGRVDGVDGTKFVNASSSVGDHNEVREHRHQFSGIV